MTYSIVQPMTRLDRRSCVWSSSEVPWGLALDLWFFSCQLLQCVVMMNEGSQHLAQPAY